MVDMERLDKVLVNKGLGSRKDMHKIIKKGLVMVDDVVIKEKDFKVTSNNKICVSGKELTNVFGNYYILMNKPKGVVSATKDEQETVIDLIKEEDMRDDIFLVGRLDKDTTGLLILTNDGEFSNKTLSPKKHVNKKYYVEVQGELKEEHIKLFNDGMELSDFNTKSSTLEIVESSDISKCYVTISEVKFHQIKRMFHHIDCEVLELKRVQFGEIYLDESLEEGEYRFFNEEEMKYVEKVKN